jgi:drug/metabolite transporter (DMT)-like permease
MDRNPAHSAGAAGGGDPGSERRCVAGLARILLVLTGAVVMLAYGTFLNLAPLQFGQVVGLYIAILFIVWQAINFLAFGATPTVSILLGGSLIVAGGLLITYWKP